MIRKIFSRRRLEERKPSNSEKDFVPDDEKDFVPKSENKEEETEFASNSEEGGWSSLRHNGPYFESLEREISREECLSYYQKIPSEYHSPTFWSNCPFRRGDLRLSVSNTEKDFGTKSEKEEREVDERIRERHSSCWIDGRRETITTWKMEPPGVFLGRGNHPLRGKFRRRVVPEDVVLNLGEGVRVPKLPPGRRWRGVVHRHGSTWLWSWMDPLLGKWKYVYPNPSSETHMVREIDKFDVARDLKGIITDIRREYTRVLKSHEVDIRDVEMAMVLYLIDRLGIRIGNIGSQTGATTLRKENVTLQPGKRRIRIEFIGKDSILYDREVHAEECLIKSFQRLLAASPHTPYLFPNTTSRDVNQYIQTIDPKLKAKVFRTYNASEIFQRSLMKRSGREGNPMDVFREASIEVAKFCNHRKIGVLRRSLNKYSPSTSITNYIDPRIGVSWAKRNSIPLSKLYSKTLLKRFEWALETPRDFIW